MFVLCHILWNFFEDEVVMIGEYMVFLLINYLFSSNYVIDRNNNGILFGPYDEL